MKKLNFGTLLILLAITLLGFGSGFAQATVSSDKKALIQEVMELTNTLNLGVKTEFNESDFEETLLKLISQDKELNENQRLELKQSASKSNARITKYLQDFNEDKNNSEELFKELNFQFYDKTFTETELKEMVVFYHTPTGQKSAKFMMTYINQLSKQYGDIYAQDLRLFSSKRLMKK